MKTPSPFLFAAFFFVLAPGPETHAARGPSPTTLAAQKISYFYSTLNHFDALEAVLRLGAEKTDQDAIHDLFKRASGPALPRLEMGKAHFLIEGMPETVKFASEKRGLKLTYRGKKFVVTTTKKTFKQNSDGILTLLDAPSGTPSGENARFAAVAYFTAYGMVALGCSSESCAPQQRWPHLFRFLYEAAWDRFSKKNISDAENFDIKSWPGTLCRKESPDKETEKLTLAFVNEETQEVTLRRSKEEKTSELKLVYRGNYPKIGVTDASFQEETYLFDETGAFRSGKDLLQDRDLRPSSASRAVLEQAVREGAFEKLCRFADSPFLRIEMAMMACEKGRKSWERTQEEFPDRPTTDTNDSFRYFQKFRNLLQELQGGLLSESEYCSDEPEATRPACKARLEELPLCMKELVKRVDKKSERLGVIIRTEKTAGIKIEPDGRINIENLEHALAPPAK